MYSNSRSKGRRRLAGLATLVGAAAAAAVAFGVMQAGATPGAGIVGGPIVARGPLPQDIAIGVPRTITVTRTVRVRVGTRTVRKRVSFKVATIQRLATCTTGIPCDIAFQQLTISPGGHTGWHTHPGPTIVSVAQGGDALPRRRRLPGAQVRHRHLVLPADDRGAQLPERRHPATRHLRPLLPPRRDPHHGDQGRPATARELPKHPVARELRRVSARTTPSLRRVRRHRESRDPDDAGALERDAPPLACLAACHESVVRRPAPRCQGIPHSLDADYYGAATSRRR